MKIYSKLIVCGLLPFRKLLPQQKSMDPDAFVDAMNKDVSECCKKKRGNDSPKKRKIAATYDSDESNDSNKNRRKKKKKSSTVDSDSDAASVDSERSSKRKRASIPPLVTRPIAGPASKTGGTSFAQEKAVSSITKNPNIQVKKVPPNQSSPRTPTATAVAKQQPKLLPKPQPKPQPRPQPQPPPSAAAVASSGDATDIDCTPDLFAFLVNHSYEQTVGSTSSAADQTAENSVSSSTSSVRAPLQTQPTPLPSASMAVPMNDVNSMVDVPPTAGNPRQYVRRVQRIQGGPNDSAPVIHNYNGMRLSIFFILPIFSYMCICCFTFRLSHWFE